MKALPFSKIRNGILLLSLLIFVGGIGYQLGERKTQVSVSKISGFTVSSQAPQSSTLDFTLFWDVWKKMFTYYIDASTLNAQAMFNGAISGMVNAAGDPYTSFFPPKENQAFKDDIGGSFEGIGAQLGIKDNHIMVIAPLKDNPAEKAGIKAGDYILKVNDEDTTNWTVQEAVTKIRGQGGTKVKLQILHEKATKTEDIEIVRGTISVPSVESWVKTVNDIKEIQSSVSFNTLKNKPGRVAYLLLSRFGDKTNDEWQKAVNTILAEQKKGDVRGLVFDLRNNPGGYLEGSVFISSEFLKSGIVVSQKNSDGTKEDYPIDRKGQLLDIPMVVLVNKGSASAAEITAGALHDHKRAQLVGETTFGKGSVQTPFELSGGASVHITTGKWLLPSGDWIHKVGITPDVIVSMDDATASDDAQLAKAIELLLK